MKNNMQRMKVLAGIALLALAASAHGLTIIPTFDSSITGDPNAAGMEAAINAAIQIFESTYTDNVTVQITFVSDSSVGLGQSDTFITTISYSSFRTALKNKATDANDTNALSKLPTGTHDPVLNGNQVVVTTALYRCLGLGSTGGGTDSTVSFNPGLVNLTRPGTNPNNYDLEEVMEHEIDEVLGTSSSLPDATQVNPMDFFRYTTNLARTFTTSGDNAYFSVDGTNLWARFNMNSEGDYADFWSDTGYWAPPGFTAHPQVQDAFGTSGQYEDLGVSELAMLDAVGWTLAVQPPPPNGPVLTIVRSSAGHVKVSWPTNSTPFMLQETTNIISSGNWVASASGTNNPAIIASSAAEKFYRLFYLAPLPDIVTGQTLSAQPATNAVSLRLVTRKYRPYNP
jgi:hypothetical protein